MLILRVITATTSLHSRLGRTLLPWTWLLLACGGDVVGECGPCEEERDRQGESCGRALEECNSASPLLTNLAGCVEAFGACWSMARVVTAECWEAPTCGFKNKGTKERCQADCSEALGECRGGAYREENRCRLEDCAQTDQTCQDGCRTISQARFDSCFEVDLLECTSKCG